MKSVCQISQVIENQEFAFVALLHKIFYCNLTLKLDTKFCYDYTRLKKGLNHPKNISKSGYISFEIFSL